MTSVTRQIALVAEIKQCIVELTEAAVILEDRYPRTASLFLKAADRARATVAKATGAATPLDEAWERINALGGQPNDEFDRGIHYAVTEALKIIEELGGADPAGRRATAANAIEDIRSDLREIMAR